MRFLLLLLPLLLSASSDHVVTYDANKGRFGDRLVSYLHAKWISHQYGIPLAYKRFKHGSELVLSKKEIPLDNQPRRIVNLKTGQIDLQSPATLYVCPYFPEDRGEIATGNWYHFDVDWKNVAFRKVVREMIAPRKRLRLIVPPKNTVNIAIHVREGGGHDSADLKLAAPLKLPPMSFYTEGLAKVLSLFPGKNIHCHVFTDASCPEEIVNLLRAAVPNSSVKFSYRKNNHYNKNILEDFFSFFNFDVFIRPQSHFSMIPSLIHDYAIVHSPTHCIVEGDRIVIDQTHTDIHPELYQKLLSRSSDPPTFLSMIWDDACKTLNLYNK